jgi:hypothetical protein
MALKILPDGSLFLEDTDWVMFYTQAKSEETKAVVEAILIEQDILKSTHKSKGIGYGVIRLFSDTSDKEIDLWRGSPRDVLKHMNDAGHEAPISDSKLAFEVINLGQKGISWLMTILPDNTLIGSNDELPGVKGSILPHKMDEL